MINNISYQDFCYLLYWFYINL